MFDFVQRNMLYEALSTDEYTPSEEEVASILEDSPMPVTTYQLGKIAPFPSSNDSPELGEEGEAYERKDKDEQCEDDDTGQFADRIHQSCEFRRGEGTYR